MAKRKGIQIPRSIPKWLLVSISLAAGYLAHQQMMPPLPIPLEEKDYVECYFSPKGGCTAAIVSSINQAQQGIEVYAYVFTAPLIADALLRAQRRGVRVRILADREQSLHKWSQIPRLYRYGIPIWIDSVAGYAHNKVMIIDNLYVITGSFNWSGGAENKNAENLLIIKQAEVVKRYRANFDRRLGGAKVYH